MHPRAALAALGLVFASGFEQQCEVDASERAAWAAASTDALRALGYEVSAGAAEGARWQFAPLGTISNPGGTYGVVDLGSNASKFPGGDDYCRCLNGDVSVSAAEGGGSPPDGSPAAAAAAAAGPPETTRSVQMSYRMQKPKKTIRITTNYHLIPTDDQLQNEEVDNVVREDARVEPEDQIQVDHIQSDDQDKDVEVVDLVEVGVVAVELGAEAHVVQSEPEES